MSSCIRSQDALYPDLVGCTIHPPLWLDSLDDLVMWISGTMSLSVNMAIWDTFPDDKSRELEARYSAPQHDHTSPRMTWNMDENWPFTNLTKGWSWRGVKINVSLIKIQNAISSIVQCNNLPVDIHGIISNKCHMEAVILSLVSNNTKCQVVVLQEAQHPVT